MTSFPAASRPITGSFATTSSEDITFDAVVVGAGVVGVTTAYALLQAGLLVCLVDRAAEPASGASFANGAQLSYAYTDALASPALLKKIPALALGLDPLFRLKPSFDPALYVWLLSFLRNMTAARFERNTRAVLELALESQHAMATLLDAHTLDFDHAVPGKMHLYYSQEALDGATRTMAIKRDMGVEQEILSAADAILREPALGQVEGLAGALHSPHDAAGDANRFSRALLELCHEGGGVETRFGWDVQRIERLSDARGFRLYGRDGAVLVGTRLVLCAGSESAVLGRRLGLSLPIQPMKGYSFTGRPGSDAPHVSLTDTKRKLVFCRLGELIRVAGLADLGFASARADPIRNDFLRQLAMESLPGAIEPGSVRQEWAGLRPMTPSSAPIIRWVDRALAVNVGHGMLGWTLAMGAAQRLARLLPN